MKMELTRKHHEAVDRPRRIVVQYDAFSQLGVEFDQWLDYRFAYVDEPGSQIDALWWDIGGGTWCTYPSKILQPLAHPGLQKWQAQGIDWVRELVSETRRRGLEVFWNHRISEVDLTPDARPAMEDLAPIKATHPDWIIKTWWWQGMWNLANPQLREWKLSVLAELAESYELDGIQVDFARHIPCLPPGRQWELREHVTEFMRSVRAMLLDVAKRRGRPFLLAARIPRNLEGCRADGFDIEAWAGENLVDILSLGSRSMDVDIEGFRAATAGSHIKLQPCFDDHHTSDAYQYAPIETLRGVFGNWWNQGADSVMTFNWSNAPREKCEAVGALPGPESHRQAYREIGGPDTLASKDKIFAVERRGGYPWAEGHFNRNDTAPLPVALRNDGQSTPLDVRVCEPLPSGAPGVKRAILRAILFGAKPGDEFAARVNGVPVPLIERDAEWKDKLIVSPKPQPASGGADYCEIDPDQQLLRLDFEVSPGLCRCGPNRVDVSITHREPYILNDIALEKLELHTFHE